MKATDYIKIPGTAPSSGNYTECLQGLTSGEDPHIITLPIWSAQTGMLTGQSAYLMLIKDNFNKRAATMPKISDDRKQFVKGIIGEIVKGVATWYSDSPIFGEIIEFGFGKIWDAAMMLKKLFTNYGVIFDTMKAENTTLSTIAMSDSAYTIRRQVMFDHYEHCKNVMAIVQQASDDIGAGGDLLPTNWKDWIKDMEKSIVDLSTWIDTAYVAMETQTEGTTPRSMSRSAAVNTPNPDLPALPVVPPQPIIPKPPQMPDQLTALLAEYLRADLILKSKGLRYQIRHGRELVQVVADVSEGVDTLKYNDEVVDFGTVRLYLKGKIIEY